MRVERVYGASFQPRIMRWRVWEGINNEFTLHLLNQSSLSGSLSTVNDSSVSINVLDSTAFGGF